MMYKWVLWIGAALLMSSCQKNNTQPLPQTELRSQHDQLIDQQFSGNWRLTSIKTAEPIDVNLDGVTSTDLMAELPAHAYVIAQLKVNWITQKRVFVDGYVRTYPATQATGNTAQYVVNGRVLFFDVNQTQTQLSLTEESQTKSYELTRTNADEFSVKGLERTYYTKDGWRTVPTISVYQRVNE